MQGFAELSLRVLVQSLLVATGVFQFLGGDFIAVSQGFKNDGRFGFPFDSDSVDFAPQRSSNDALLQAQLAEMVLSRLATEAVLTQSHIYMDRAWRVAALCGFPTVEEFERIDFN